MAKYKNKDGIELNFGGMSKAGRDGSGVTLIQEVVSEAITILKGRTKSTSTISDAIEFLK